MSNSIDYIFNKYECIGAGSYGRSTTFYFKKDPAGNELVVVFIGSPKVYETAEDFSEELGRASKEAGEIGAYKVKSIKILGREGDASWEGYIEYVAINKE